jgi:hypothetical protein
MAEIDIPESFLMGWGLTDMDLLESKDVRQFIDSVKRDLSRMSLEQYKLLITLTDQARVRNNWQFTAEEEALCMMMDGVWDRMLYEEQKEAQAWADAERAAGRLHKAPEGAADSVTEMVRNALGVATRRLLAPPPDPFLKEELGEPFDVEEKDG